MVTPGTSESVSQPWAVERGDVSLNGAGDVPRGADQIPETVIVTTLRTSCSGHHSIMTNPTG